MPLARCIRDCWDSKRTIRYYRGDQDDIDPKNPVAKHFEFVDPKIEATKYGTKIKVEEPVPQAKEVEKISVVSKKKRGRVKRG